MDIKSLEKYYYKSFENITVYNLFKDTIMAFKNDTEKISVGYHHRTDNYLKPEFYNTKSKVKNNDINIDYGFLVLSIYDHNLRHFLVESFYNICFFIEHLKIQPKLKMIIPENIPKHVECVLKILDLEKHVIRIKNNSKINISSLIILTKYNFLIVRNEDLCVEYIEKFIDKCKNLSSFKNKEIDYLFIEKKNAEKCDHRQIINYNEIHKKYVEDKKKLFKITPEELEFHDQITIMNNSKNIITFLGASCDNINFTNMNTKMYIILADNEHHIRWANWYLNYYKEKTNLILCGEQIRDERNLVLQVDYPWKIDSDKFKEFINNLLYKN